MRDAFFSELENIFLHDPRVIFLTGDLGFKLFDRIRGHDAERVINCGIREAGMIGYAAGLARTGMRPFVYSIVPFVTLRSLEQIKIDLCYNRSPVVLVGVGGGFAYGPNGTTHHGIDDIGALSCLPGLTVFTPADAYEVGACIAAVIRLDGPAYLRLGRNNEPLIFPGRTETPDITRPALLRKGDAGTIITCGFLLTEVLAAADRLEKDGQGPTIVRIATLRPFPCDEIRAIINNGAPVLTVEEHIATGGLGLETARIIAEGGYGNRFRMLATPLDFPHACMDRSALLNWAGIDAKAIAEAFTRLVKQ